MISHGELQQMLGFLSQTGAIFLWALGSNFIYEDTA